MIESYLAFIRLQKGLSKNTEAAYRIVLRDWQAFLAERQGGLLTAGKVEIHAFVQKLREGGLSNRSIAAKLCALRQFYKYLIREEKVTANPLDYLDVRLRFDPKPKVLTQEQVERLLEQITHVKHRALVEFLYSTGCRVSEALSLKTKDIDWKQRVAKVMGKGKKERFVILTECAVEWMQKYGGSEGKTFFDIGRQMAFKIVDTAARNAGIKQRVSPHVLRHSFATHVLRGGIDLAVLRDLLGHTSIAATQVYTHPSLEDLISDHKKAHPRQ